MICGYDCETANKIVCDTKYSLCGKMKIMKLKYIALAVILLLFSVPFSIHAMNSAHYSVNADVINNINNPILYSNSYKELGIMGQSIIDTFPSQNYIVNNGYIYKALYFINDSPVLTLQTSSITVEEDTDVFTLTLTSLDISDSDPYDTIGNISIAIYDTELVNVTVDTTTNDSCDTIYFTVIADTFGTDTITIKITDSLGAYDTALFIITIISINDEPVITSLIPGQTEQEDTNSWQIELMNYKFDMDGDNLYWSVTGGGTVVNVSISNNNILIINPVTNANGSETITLYLTDNSETVSQDVIITLTPVNDSPYFVSSPNLIAFESLYYSYRIIAYDTDNIDLNFGFVSNPGGAEIIELSDTTAILTWTPPDTAAYHFEIYVEDSYSARDTQIFEITAYVRPRSVKNFVGQANIDGSVTLSWSPPPFGNISQYILSCFETNSNTVFYQVFDTSILNYIVPADSLIMENEYIFEMSIKDINGYESTDTPPRVKIIPHIGTGDVDAFCIIYKPKPEKKIFLDIAAQGNILSLEARIVGNIDKLDYVQFEYRNTNDTLWQTMSSIIRAQGKLNSSNIKDTSSIVVMWNIHQDNIVVGVYDLRGVVYEDDGDSDRYAKVLTLEFVSDEDLADIVEKIDSTSDTYYYKETVILGEDTITKSILYEKESNKEFGISINIPSDIITEDSKVELFGSKNVIDKIIIERINLNVLNEITDSNNKIQGKDIYNIDAPILNIDFQGLKTSDTYTFSKPVTIQFSYLDEDDDGWVDNVPLLHETNIGGYYRKGNQASDWIKIYSNSKWNIDIDYNKNLVTLKAPHFTSFAIFSSMPSPSANQFTVFPNPFTPNDGNPNTGIEYTGSAVDMSGIIFYNIPANCSIKIYTMTGGLVRELSSNTGQAKWDVKNTSGNKATSGWYIYLIQGSGQNIVGKLAIVR